jgi:hypothetical protein
VSGAIVAAKARGVKLGNPNGARALKGKQVGNSDAVATIKANVAQHAADLQGIADDIRRSGITTVADELHSRGIRAPRGDTWAPNGSRKASQSAEPRNERSHELRGRPDNAADYRNAHSWPRSHRGGFGGHWPGARARWDRNVVAHALRVNGMRVSNGAPLVDRAPF